jgi:putative peptidoglycan lipid II flippase
VATNLAVIALLHGRLGYRAIALGTALGSLVNAALLVGVFQRRVGGLGTREVAGRLARMIAAAAVMAPLVWGSAHLLEREFGTRGLVAQLVTGLGPVAVGAIAYLSVCLLVRLPEVQSLLKPVLRRLRRQSGEGPGGTLQS